MSRRIGLSCRRDSGVRSTIWSWWRKRIWPLVGVVARRINAPGRRLAAAGLADQPQRLALADLEADAVDRLDVPDHAAKQAALDREVLLDVADVQQDVARRVGWVRPLPRSGR